MPGSRFDWSDVERQRAMLLVIARAMLRNAWPVKGKLNASDVVQETMIKAHRGLPQFEGCSEQELMAWLRRILGNALCDAVRRFSRGQRNAALEDRIRDSVDESAGRFDVVLAASVTSPSEVVARVEVTRRLAEALLELPEDQRTAIELHYLDGHTVAETAQRMARTRPSVAGLIRRGLKTLRTVVAEHASLGITL